MEFIIELYLYSKKTLGDVQKLKKLKSINA
jgi:hypothetical protein